MTARAKEDRTAVIEALHEALASENSLTRCHAVRVLARLDARGRVTARRLIALLLDPDPDVRTESAVALGRLGICEAVGPLVNNLKHDPEGEVRIQAATALGKIGAPAAMAPLIHCLRHDGYPQLNASGGEFGFGVSWEVQSRCLEALGALGESATGASLHRGPIADVQDARMPRRPGMAESGLVPIGDTRATDAVIALLTNDDYEHLQESGFRVLARLAGGRARSFLLEQLRHGRRLARRRAARALGELKLRRDRRDQKLLDGLLAALDDTDPDVRIGAVRALGRQHRPTAIVPLTRLLRDSDREVREVAATMLGKTRNRRAIRPLHALLDEADPKLRRAVVAVLGEIADPTSVKPLSELLASADDNLRYAVIRALESIGVPGPEPALAALLDDRSNDPGIRLAAADALGKITTRSRQKNRGQSRDSDPDFLSALERAVHNRNPGVAFAALNALVRIEPRRAGARLTALLRGAAPNETPNTNTSGGDEATRGGMTPRAAAEAFGYARGTDAASATLVAIAADTDAMGAAETGGTTAGDMPDLRCFAARLLGGLAEKSGSESRLRPRFLRALQAAFETGETELCREVLLALGRIGDARTVPTILAGLAAPEAELRLTAIDALGRMENVKRRRKNWGRSLDSDPNFSKFEKALTRLMQDDEPAVRERAVQALDRHGLRRLPVEHWQRLLNDEDPSVCRAALGSLSRTNADANTADLVVDTMFRHSGELRHEAAGALRHLGRAPATARLLSLLNDPKHDELHWICLDAIADLHARQPAHPGTWGSR